MAAYTITRTGLYLRFAESGGDVRLFFNPLIRVSATPAYPATSTPYLEIRQGEGYLQLQVSDIVSINGLTPALLGGTLQACADALQTLPGATAVVQTSATGATAVVLPAGACSSAVIINQSGAAIDLTLGSFTVSLASGLAYCFTGLTNANQLSVRRTDQSNTQVPVSYRTAA